MKQVYIDVFSNKDFSSFFAISGFLLPFVPDFVHKSTASGYLEWFAKEHLYLLEQQIQFLRKFHFLRKALQQKGIYALFASEQYQIPSFALELRFVADYDTFGKREIKIYILNRVSNRIEAKDNKQQVYYQVQQFARKIHTHIQQTFPIEYTLQPLSKEDWPFVNSIDIQTLTSPKCTAEIRRYVDESGFPYPLIWSQNTYSQLLALLLRSRQKLILSISIEPDFSLRELEKNRLQDLATRDIVPIEFQDISKDFLARDQQLRQGPKAVAADYYLRTLQRPFLLRIQVLSDKPIDEGVLQAIGEEISPTQDFIKVTDTPFFGLWPSFQYLYPKPHELEIALNNFKYIRRDFWGNDSNNASDRLLYLVGATEANAAFRIPLPTLHGVPGIETLPFNPFVSYKLGSSHPARQQVELGIDTHGNNFVVNVDDFTKHVLIVGSTGSGKTTTSQRILSELWKYKIPFWVIEPAKSEYRHFLTLDIYNKDLKSEILLFTLGGIVSPFVFNPFEVPPGISINTYVSAIKSCFMAAFPLGGPLNIVLEKALREIYRDKKWDLFERVTESSSKSFPTLLDLYRKVGQIISTLDYSGEIKSNISAALHLRIGNMLDSILGQVFVTRPQEQFQTWTWEELLTRPVIFEMESIADDDEKALVISMLFTILSFYQRRYYEMRKSSGDAAALRHITLIEEAHRLFANPGGQDPTEGVTSKSKVVETFANSLAEMRAYGEGFIIAEQIPTKLYMDIIKHPNLKIMHRITAEEDRAILGAAMNFSEQHRRYVTTLQRGAAAIYLEGLHTPVLVSVYPPEKHTVPDNLLIMKEMAVQNLAKLLTNLQNAKRSECPDKKGFKNNDVKAYFDSLARRMRQLHGGDDVQSISDFCKFVAKLLTIIERKHPYLSLEVKCIRLKFRQCVSRGEQ